MNYKSTDPLISIVTVVLNAKFNFEKTIKNIKNQTYKNIEIIVIDGGSTDGTLDAVPNHLDIISYWISEKDSGIYDAMNKGINKCNGEWIIFMNSGDTFYSNNTLTDIFTKTYDADVVYGHMIADYGSFQKINYASKVSSSKYEKPYCHQSCFIAKKSIIHFNTKYKLTSDYHQYLEMVRANYKFHLIDIIVSIYSIDGVSNFNRKTIFEKEQIHKDHWPNYKSFDSIKYITSKSPIIILSLLKDIVGEKLFRKIRIYYNKMKRPSQLKTYNRN